MGLAQGLVLVAILGGLAAAASAPGQTPAQSAAPAATASAAVAAPASAPASAPAPKTYTVPAGTKVLLQLRSSVNTKSAKAGDGVYLASIFPVTVGNRV